MELDIEDLGSLEERKLRQLKSKGERQWYLFTGFLTVGKHG
jgi:hypothetical protein